MTLSSYIPFNCIVILNYIIDHIIILIQKFAIEKYYKNKLAQ